MQHQIAHVSSRFNELRGATVELWGMIDSHQTYVFRVTDSPSGYGKLYFSNVMDAELLTIMHEVHFRFATDEENEALINRLTEWQSSWITPPMDLMDYHPSKTRIAIDCNEGTFFMWAQFLEITWQDDPDIGIDQELIRMRRQIWTDGPTIREL